MKKILILNGSSRKNGYTSSLVNSFIDGAKNSGNEVKEHFIHGMNINYCLGCDKCMETHKGCVQKKDDMNVIYEDLTWADVIVFASPEYWGTFTAELKTAIDRMFGWFNLDGNFGAKKDCALLMTARGDDYSMAIGQYNIFTKILGWNDLGMVLGRSKEDESKKLGESIK
ncbi:MAG: flavodoxin family protein [Methanobrevibacter sp.]|nr:flavodoxin family protein [Methanobrevibacter sp.]